MTRTNTLIEHIYRSADQCADHLARVGAEQNEELGIEHDMPISIREFVFFFCSAKRNFLLISKGYIERKKKDKNSTSSNKELDDNTSNESYNFKLRIPSKYPLKSSTE
ncbi:hypothetical protein RHGRI_020126 [Rhododendron griersonianum]|nr:hypothetical protein RHGRI_020126 [Rhododendron griersonianum]